MDARGSERAVVSRNPIVKVSPANWTLDTIHPLCASVPLKLSRVAGTGRLTSSRRQVAESSCVSCVQPAVGAGKGQPFRRAGLALLLTLTVSAETARVTQAGFTVRSARVAEEAATAIGHECCECGPAPGSTAAGVPSGCFLQVGSRRTRDSCSAGAVPGKPTTTTSCFGSLAGNSPPR